MPTYEYIQSAVNRTPRPRSERLRKLGGAIVSADFTASSMAGIGVPDHTHSNLDSLNMITVDDGYIYLTSWVDDNTSVTAKAKAGYADKALTNNDGYTLDWFIPTTVDGVLTLKVNPRYTVLWSDGAMSSFGYGFQGGSGVDLDRVWQSLANNTDKPNVKIHAAHLVSTNPAEAVGLIIGSGLSYDSATRTLSATGGGGTGSVNAISVGNSLPYGPDSDGLVALPAYPTIPTTLKNPYALTFGGKTYDGSAAKTIKASDLGALTEVPKATSSVIGGFQTGYSGSGQNYAVQMSGNKAFVNVPWTDTVYSLPLAASGTRGGIQIGFSESNSGSDSTRNYAVKLSSEKAYVNVPWTDTVYTHPTNGANKTISAADGRVLSAITVNSLGHVTSVSSKTLVAADIPDLSGAYLPLTGGTLTGSLTIQNNKTLTLGNGVLSWDSANNAWKLTGNLIVTGFLTGFNTNP